MFVDFLVQRRAALKNHKSYADERINTEMKSLSIPCVRGQPMLAGGNGGGGREPKKTTINRTWASCNVLPLDYTSYTLIKMREIK
jgi:hypothetical protein